MGGRRLDGRMDGIAPLGRGASHPIERRDILLLTLFPVLAGIVLAMVVAARDRVVRPSRVLPLRIHLGFVSVFYLVAYVLSVPYAS